MELGSNFAAKLEPFLLMSKSAKGAAAAKLIENATSAPGVFVFAELLELPNIQEVRVHDLVPVSVLMLIYCVASKSRTTLEALLPPGGLLL